MFGKRRREFITLLGGAAAWPVLGNAQQRSPAVIGFLNSGSADAYPDRVVAFREGLSELGFVEDQNVIVLYRWAFGQYNRLPGLAEELVQRPVSVLVSTGGEPAALAAKAATSTLPIVFAVGSDPVKLGLVKSYNRPGTNATGATLLTAALEPKRLGLVRELVAGSAVMGILLNPDYPAYEAQLSDVQQAARAVSFDLRIFRANTDQDIESAFQSLAEQHIPALAVAAAPFFDTRRERLVHLAARYSVPTIYHFREFAAAGGLVSYGVSISHIYRQIGIYTGRILKGDKPGDLPVVQPTKFELVINLKTAKALGLAVSPSLLAIADELIEVFARKRFGQKSFQDHDLRFLFRSKLRPF
jgi:putative ABC transport system substrate-binding protein